MNKPPNIVQYQVVYYFLGVYFDFSPCKTLNLTNFPVLTCPNFLQLPDSPFCFHLICVKCRIYQLFLKLSENGLEIHALSSVVKEGNTNPLVDWSTLTTCKRVLRQLHLTVYSRKVVRYWRVHTEVTSSTIWKSYSHCWNPGIEGSGFVVKDWSRVYSSLPLTITVHQVTDTERSIPNIRKSHSKGVFVCTLSSYT